MKPQDIDRIVEAVIKEFVKFKYWDYKYQGFDIRVKETTIQSILRTALESVELTSEREVLFEYEMTVNRNTPRDEWPYFPNITRNVYFKINDYLKEKGESK